MSNLGLELCDVGLKAAVHDGAETRSIAVADTGGVTDWPGFAYYDGRQFTYGRAAEDQWLVHPWRVVYTFWSRLAHEPSPLGPPGRPVPFSEMGYHFLRAFTQRLGAAPTLVPEKVVLAVPGSYLKDEATEEEKVGLLLGMAGELKLPVAGIIDMACASLCDPRATGFNPALPVVVVDLHLEGAELTLFTTDGRLERKDFIHLPLSGLAQLLKHLTATMGNRFLRHTSFDILEDGRIEQTFFRQTKDFLISGAPEHRFQINTATRAYEMLAKREQIVQDAAAFATALAQGVQSFVRSTRHASEPCTIAMSERAAIIPGLGARLRAAGFSRQVSLPAGAAASGAAYLGGAHLKPQPELSDVPVLSGVPIELSRRSQAAPWEARLQKLRLSSPSPSPTHVILDGIGHNLGNSARFTIGVTSSAADLVLPDAFNVADDCAIPLVREGGRLWFVDTAEAGPGNDGEGQATRTIIDAGDRLTIRCGSVATDVLFAHCTVNGSRDRD